MVTATSQSTQNESTIAQSASDFNPPAIPEAYRLIVNHMTKFFEDHPELLKTEAQS